MRFVLYTDSEDQRRERFEYMFRAHYHAVDAFVMGQFPHADHDDVMSVTFETAWRRFDDIPADASRGWLIGVARNTALNSLRGRRRRRARLDAFGSLRPRSVSRLHDHDLAPEILDQLQAAFDRLRPQDREVIQLAEIDGLVGDELGAALGVSAGTAAVRLHRARKRIQALFNGAGDES